MDAVILTTSETSVEAHLIKHKLENENIDCFIANENSATMLPNLYRMLGSGVQVFVNENDFERASQIISEATPEQISCPNCGSSNLSFSLGNKKRVKWLVIIISLLTATPFNNLNNRFVCKDCKKEFKK